jgi:hypothetical protein
LIKRAIQFSWLRQVLEIVMPGLTTLVRRSSFARSSHVSIFHVGNGIAKCWHTSNLSVSWATIPRQMHIAVESAVAAVGRYLDAGFLRNRLQLAQEVSSGFALAIRKHKIVRCPLRHRILSSLFQTTFAGRDESIFGTYEITSIGSYNCPFRRL